jgi:type VI secretion system FHA domain protein
MALQPAKRGRYSIRSSNRIYRSAGHDMYLTLEVISANGAALGDKRRIVVGEEGAYIGRGPTNDWVIDDPYISREHACIRYLKGAFYVEGIGKNPVAISDPKSTVPNNEPQILRSGERFFLDQYEIKATISGPQPVSAPPQIEDPFSDEPVPAPAPRPATPRREEADPLAGLDEGGEAEDVRKVFGIGSKKDEPTLSPVDLHQISPIHESFTPRPGARLPVTQKPTPSRPSAGAASGIDDWDHTHFTAVVTTPSQPPPAIEPPAPKVRPQVGSPGARRPVEPAPVLVPKRAQAPVVEKPQPARPRAPEWQPPPPIAATTDNYGLAELLRAAGVPAGQLSPEMAAELGQVYRVMVQGVMDALRARAEIKLQFRLQTTRVQANDNNPLKFSPNIEAALHTLLVERNRGYMSSTRAFQDAFEDLRNHQIAILAGIRAAFNSMLDEFNPARLQEKLEGESKRGLLKVGGKGRFQDLYAEHFRSLTSDADECFRRLFGEVFGEAYEKQLEELKRAGGDSRD